MDLKNERPVDWYGWSFKEMESMRKFYTSVKWCDNHKDMLRQYEDFQQAVLMVNNNKERILRGIINSKKSPELKQFLTIHSVFDIDDNKNSDWLVKLMLEELSPTDKDVEEAHKKDEIPDFIMEKLSIFNPQPFGFEKNWDNVKIYYKMVGNWKDGVYTEPITVIDRDWEWELRKLTNKELVDAISRYKNIAIV